MRFLQRSGKTIPPAESPILKTRQPAAIRCPKKTCGTVGQRDKSVNLVFVMAYLFGLVPAWDKLGQNRKI